MPSRSQLIFCWSLARVDSPPMGLWQIRVNKEKKWINSKGWFILIYFARIQILYTYSPVTHVPVADACFRLCNHQRRIQATSHIHHPIRYIMPSAWLYLQEHVHSPAPQWHTWCTVQACLANWSPTLHPTIQVIAVKTMSALVTVW